MLGIALYINAVFTVNAKKMFYGSGNSSYIWMPLSMLLSLGAFLLAAHCMKKTNAPALNDLIYAGAGKPLGKVCMGILALLLFLGALLPTMQFVSMLHSYAFNNTGSHFGISLWVLFTMLVLCLWGMETISRLSRLLVGLFIISILCSLVITAPSYQTYRLYPLPGNPPAQIGLFTLQRTYVVLPAMLGMLCLTKNQQGLHFARTGGIIAAAVAMALAFAAQFSVSLTFPYQELAQMLDPFYSLDISLLKEGFLFRMDKVFLFLWLGVQLVAGSFFVFAAGAVLKRDFALHSTRVSSVAVLVLMACVMLLQHMGGEAAVNDVLQFLDRYCYLLLLLPLAAALLGVIRHKEVRHEHQTV